MPAKAGIQDYLRTVVSRFRGKDAKGGFKTLNESIRFRSYLEERQYDLCF